MQWTYHDNGYIFSGSLHNWTGYLPSIYVICLLFVFCLILFCGYDETYTICQNELSAMRYGQMNALPLTVVEVLLFSLSSQFLSLLVESYLWSKMNTCSCRLLIEKYSLCTHMLMHGIALKYYPVLGTCQVVISCVLCMWFYVDLLLLYSSSLVPATMRWRRVLWNWA